MCQLAMNQMTTYRWSFEEDIERYAAHGFGATGIWRQKLSDFGEEKGIELLAENGMAVSSLSWAGGFTGSDGWAHGESVADGREAIELAAALQANCLVVHSGPRGLHTQNHVRRLLREALEELLPLAEARRVTLALEPMHPAAAARWTFLTSLDDVLALVASFESPRLKLVLDCYDWGREGALRERLPRLIPHVALVQLADCRAALSDERNRCPLGLGNVPLPGLVSDLTAGGYRGPYEVELLGEEIEASDYESLLEGAQVIWRRCAEESKGRRATVGEQRSKIGG